jgi:hypothetical protein
MPVHRFGSRALIALLLLASALLAGCVSQNATSTLRPDTTHLAGATMTTEPSGSQSDRWVPPVVLHHPSPGKLDVYIVATMGGYDRTSRETTTIGLSFGFNGQPVQFAGSERLMCNGTVISLRNQVASSNSQKRSPGHWRDRRLPVPTLLVELQQPSRSPSRAPRSFAHLRTSRG